MIRQAEQYDFKHLLGYTERAPLSPWEWQTFKNLRERGKSYTQIATIMNRPLGTVRGWGRKIGANV